MSTQRFRVTLERALNSNSDVSNLIPIVGFARPIPWAPSFLFPVFRVDGVAVAQSITALHIVEGFTPIAIDETFVQLSCEPSTVQVDATSPIYALWLPDQTIVAADPTALPSLFFRVSEQFSQYSNFSRELQDLIDSLRFRTAGSPELQFEIDHQEIEAFSNDSMHFKVDLHRDHSSSESFTWFGFKDDFSIGLRITDLGEAYVKVFVGGLCVWGEPEDEGLRIGIPAFVRFFAENWDAIQLEAFPNNIQVPRVSDWHHTMARINQNKTARLVERTAIFTEKFNNFRSRHCLVDIMPTGMEQHNHVEIWFFSYANAISIDVPELNVTRSLLPVDWRDIVEHTTDYLVQQLQATSSQNHDLHSAIQLWGSRDSRPPTNELVYLYTGIDDESVIGRIARTLRPEDSTNLLSHMSEILAAARMRPVGLNSEDLQLIFDRIESTPYTPSPALDELSSRLIYERTYSLRPGEVAFESGYAIACWLREQLNETSAVNPLKILNTWGIKVTHVTLWTNSIDAVGYWGPRHGPGIVVNNNGIHSQFRAGRRATLAHEICHLLVDRKGALPLVDVFGGQVDEEVEKRARAFAAELLLPQSIAYQRLMSTDGSLHEVFQATGEMMSEFGVSSYVAGHQCRNAIKRFCSTMELERIRGALWYLESITSFYD